MINLNFGFGALDYLERLTGRKCSQIFAEMEKDPSIALFCDLYMAGRFDDTEGKLTRKEAGLEIDKILAEEGFQGFMKALKDAINMSPVLGSHGDNKKKSAK